MAYCGDNSIKLRSGRYLDIANPKPEQFTFTDIAGALSKICRFGAQIRSFYSVAEHCMLCAHQAELDGQPIEAQRDCLLHDAAEAFIGDVVRPLKGMLPEYREIEATIENVIALKFNLLVFPSVVAEIDLAMLFAERRWFFGDDGSMWDGQTKARKIEPFFACYEYINAEQFFTLKAEELGIDVNI